VAPAPAAVTVSVRAAEARIIAPAAATAASSARIEADERPRPDDSDLMPAVANTAGFLLLAVKRSNRRRSPSSLPNHSIACGRRHREAAVRRGGVGPCVSPSDL
jgi:hypothetical protein